jgi:hypothetical protein
MILLTTFSVDLKKGWKYVRIIGHIYIHLMFMDPCIVI